jgi:hypothetical protein
MTQMAMLAETGEARNGVAAVRVVFHDRGGSFLNRGAKSEQATLVQYGEREQPEPFAMRPLPRLRSLTLPVPPRPVVPIFSVSIQIGPVR